MIGFEVFKTSDPWIGLDTAWVISVCVMRVLVLVYGGRNVNYSLSCCLLLPVVCVSDLQC